jgi:hypothetical protein
MPALNILVAALIFPVLILGAFICGWNLGLTIVNKRYLDILKNV